jgi:hypothetical protein
VNTGRPIVRDVIRTDRAMPERGAYRTSSSAGMRRSRSLRPLAARGYRVEPSPDTSGAGPGFVAMGPGISRGSELRDGHILDFAPTLLARLGVAVPEHMHGRVWRELTAT